MLPDRSHTASHRRFALVLCGGGARGLAHAGVLRALEHYGYRPVAILGVSMGAIVGATYALNPRWYTALLDADTLGFPRPPGAWAEASLRSRLREWYAAGRLIREMLTDWGIGSRSRARAQELLRALTLGRNLEDARIPIAVVATDLYSGERVVLTSGSAAEAAYASGAIAGVFPPVARGEYLLADGVYVDEAPIDVARASSVEAVIAVDSSQQIPPPAIRNGLQAMLRGTEICRREHTRMRLAEADLVLRPQFPFAIDTLDFDQKRICMAAGARAVRASLRELRELLRARAQVRPSRVAPVVNDGSRA